MLKTIVKTITNTSSLQVQPITMGATYLQCIKTRWGKLSLRYIKGLEILK
jgi:hypothetical protein